MLALLHRLFALFIFIITCILVNKIETLADLGFIILFCFMILIEEIRAIHEERKYDKE